MLIGPRSRYALASPFHWSGRQGAAGQAQKNHLPPPPPPPHTSLDLLVAPKRIN